MNKEELVNKIMDNFYEGMSEDERHLLIRVLNAVKNIKDISKEPSKDLFEIQKTWDKVSSKLYNNNKVSIKLYNNSIRNSDVIFKSNANDFKFEDYASNHGKLDETTSDEFRKNDIGYLNTKVEISDKNIYKLETRLLEDYIMADDCLKNYESDKAKKKILILLTEMEILLKMQITFPSQLPSCIDSLTSKESVKKRGKIKHGK